MIIIIGGIAGNGYRFLEKAPDQKAEFSKIPMVIEEQYFGREYAIDDMSAEVLKASVTTNRVYTATDGSVFQLFMAYFESQKYGSQIHSPKHCLPGSGWKIETIEAYEWNLSNGAIKSINRAVIRDQFKEVVMLYWYETRTGSIRGEYGLKLDLVRNSIILNPTDAVIIRLIISADGMNTAEATEKGIDFLNKLYPYLDKSLPF